MIGPDVLCALCRFRPAIGAWEDTGEPRCAECVELELERTELVAGMSRELAYRLPSLEELARGEA